MKRIAFVRPQSSRMCSSKRLPLAQWLGASYSHHPRSGFALKMKQSPKEPNWLSRRHSWNSISGRITSTDDDLRLRHAYRVHELIESSCVRKGQTNASMRYCCAEARMVRAMCPRCVKKIAWGIPALSHSREYPVTRTRSWGPVRRCLEFVTRSWVCQCLEFETRSRSGRSQEKRASRLEQQRLASGNVSSDQ